MVLQALNQYYDILVADAESGISPLGYSSTGVSFALNLSATGELLDIFPLFDQVQRGKKTYEAPRRMIVPEQVKRAVNIAANFLCDNSAYVLGLSAKNEGDPKYAQKRFEAFRQLHLDLLAEADCDAARAVTAFLKTYDPQSGREHPVIAAHLENLSKGGNLVFKLEGSPGFIHQDPQIQRIWEIYKAQTNGLAGQCLVTGETAPLARLHPSVKGIKDANPTGATLVGFNARAYESYGKEQGSNSPVSEKAAFAYTTALNYLLSSENKNRKFSLGDTTVVYWAESRDPVYASIFAGLFGLAQDAPVTAGPDETNVAPVQDKKAERFLAAVAEKVQHAGAVDINGLLQGLDGNTRFYVLGLAPNAARISVRFFQRDPFQKMVQKIMAHYEDMAIVKEYEDQPDQIPLWKIIEETVSKKSSNKNASPLMAGAMFRSILSNTPYPAALYYAIINRVRADHDDKEQGISKINYTRAAIIKAYLIRKVRHQAQSQIKEVLSMSLNEKATQPAYLLGRLFAVLENVQQEAIGDVNASIKDRYFTSACASPASIFPVLLRLSQHHIPNAKHGRSSDRRIEEILNLLDVEKNPIPAHLTLDEQGVFILGYYHQRADFYVPRANGIKSAEELPTEN
jgi:CRISPR-associated protein Csd1